MPTGAPADFRYDVLVDHPSILVLGYSEAAMLMRGGRGAQVGAILSICGSREHPVQSRDGLRHLVISFDDIDVPAPTDRIANLAAYLRQKWQTQMGRSASPPTSEHVNSIIDFARQTARLDAAVLCHCLAGVSRSSAAALLCLAVWTGEGNEEYCVNEIMRICPSAMPHRGLVRMGDELLCRNGRLIEAVVQSGLRKPRV